MVDPQYLDLPPGLSTKVIWLDRNPADQAASMLKFAEMIMGIPFQEKDISTVADSLPKDREKALAKFDGLDIHFTSFERAINDTHAFAVDIWRFLLDEYGDRLQIDDMVECVLPRKNGAATEPGLDIELQLIALTKGVK